MFAYICKFVMSILFHDVQAQVCGSPWKLLLFKQCYIIVGHE